MGKDFLEHLVVDLEAGSQLVRRAGPSVFICEMKQAGIVFVVRPLEGFEKAGVDVRPRREGAKLLVGLDTPILAHPEEDDPVDGRLDGVINLPDGEGRVANGDVSRQKLTPVVDVF